MRRGRVESYAIGEREECFVCRKERGEERGERRRESALCMGREEINERVDSMH